MKEFLDLGNDITAVDAFYSQSGIVAMYLIKHNDRVAIIDTGTQHSVAYIRAALAKHKLDFSNVAYIIPTHVHLDHAAGAGALMALSKNAKLIIHPRGARHMADPRKLIAGTIAVYGEAKFNQLYGKIEPIDANRIITADDGFKLDFFGRELRFIDTPGHAKHHFCIWDKLSATMFTGDTFGVSYREFDQADKICIFPTTTPTQFDPEVLLTSIDKIMQYQPSQICLTHFCAIKPSGEVVKQLKSGIHHFSQLAQQHFGKPNAKQLIKDGIMRYLVSELKKIGYHPKDDFYKTKLDNDIELNAQGLLYWQQTLNK